MEEHGYAVIEHAISPEFADEVRAAVLRALLPHQTFSMNWMLYHGREFERLIQNPAADDADRRVARARRRHRVVQQHQARDRDPA